MGKFHNAMSAIAHTSLKDMGHGIVVGTKCVVSSPKAVREHYTIDARLARLDDRAMKLSRKQLQRRREAEAAKAAKVTEFYALFGFMRIF